MTDTTAEKKDTSASNKAYGDAMTALREKYRVEFDALLIEKRAALNLPPTTRRTPEQVAADKAALAAERAAIKEAARKEKAKATLDALLSEFPDLAPDSTPF